VSVWLLGWGQFGVVMLDCSWSTGPALHRTWRGWHCQHILAWLGECWGVGLSSVRAGIGRLQLVNRARTAYVDMTWRWRHCSTSWRGWVSASGAKLGSVWGGSVRLQLVNRASTAYDNEVEALQHILAWLGECVGARLGSIWVVVLDFSWSTGPALHMTWRWGHCSTSWRGWVSCIQQQMIVPPSLLSHAPPSTPIVASL
jgi:hypothetical protein